MKRFNVGDIVRDFYGEWKVVKVTPSLFKVLPLGDFRHAYSGDDIGYPFSHSCNVFTLVKSNNKSKPSHLPNWL